MPVSLTGFVPIKYGYLRGFRVFVDAVPIAASVVFTSTGGKFVALDANGRLVVATSTTTQLYGWAEVGALTASATAGADAAQVDVSLLSMFRVPSDTTPTATSRGKVCDLTVSSNLQKAAISTSTNQNLKLVEANTANAIADVMINPQKFFTATAP